MNGLSALAVGSAERVGRYVYHVREDRWWWSDSMYRIHGFEPGEVRPSTDVVLAHKHPDDAAASREVILRILDTGEPFSCYHRIVDARRRVRNVVAVADAVQDGNGMVTDLHGYLVDLTESRHRDTAERANAAVRGAIAHRVVIEQAKGAIMFAYGIDADAAFSILAACSQEANLKVNQLARRLMEVNTAASVPFPLARQRLAERLEGVTGGPMESLRDSSIGA
jgi:hypothetical protein